MDPNPRLTTPSRTASPISGPTPPDIPDAVPNAVSAPATTQAAATPITLTVNGTAHTLTLPPITRLLDLLRDHLRLTGTKEGCGEGECGACAVLLNGNLVNSCLLPALHADGASVTTIEGLALTPPPSAASTLPFTPAPQQNTAPSLDQAALLPHLAPIQRCFLEAGGAQCGICTPGMILATHHLLQHNPHPTDAEIQEALAGNLCRCTGYTRILAAVHRAATTKYVEPTT